MAGIHAERFVSADPASVDGAVFAELEREHGVRPRWALPRFCWQAT
jgi:hypothetical protein